MGRKYFFLPLFFLLLFLSPFTEKSFASSPAADYLCEQGAILYKMGSYADALTEFDKALMIDPDSETAKKYINDIFKQEFTVLAAPPAAEAAQVSGEESPALKNQRVISQAQEKEMEEAIDNILQKAAQEKSDFTFYSGAHLRTSYNILGNNVDLDNNNHADHLNYLGIAYDFTLDLRHISGAEFYAFIERRGRADYDAPVTGNRSIDTIFGTYQWYRKGNLFPRVRETWLEVPLSPTEDLDFKLGLYPYGREIGHRIALGGKYENYGVTLSGKNELFDWNLHWEKEDLNNRIHLGKVVSFDKVNRFNDTNAYFYAGDATFKLGKQKAQFYLGWLQDWTPEGSRNNRFANIVKKEDLITPGVSLNFDYGKLNLGLEGATNLGKARSINNTPDVTHKGYLLIADASYDLGSFKPKTKFFVASGNKFNGGDVDSQTIPGGKNRAFSVFSPLNTNLTDSHYQKQFGPYLAMAGGYAVNFGVQRPGTFGDPFIFENLIAFTLGFDYTPTDKWYVGIDYWYLRTKENAYGRNAAAQIIKLSHELGSELDIFTSYQLTKNIKLSLLGGYFFPGNYYKAVRSDNNRFAPTPRRDGEADGAYQLELGVDISF